jgi:hypothetical protein
MRVRLAHGDAGPLLAAPRGDGGDEAAQAGPASWHFALLRLGSAGDDAHLAAVCATGGAADAPLQLRCWRTVPLSEGSDDEQAPTLLAFGG